MCKDVEARWRRCFSQYGLSLQSSRSVGLNRLVDSSTSLTSRLQWHVRGRAAETRGEADTQSSVVDDVINHMAAASVNSTIGIGGTNYSAYSFPGFPPTSFHYCNGKLQSKAGELRLI